MLKIRTITGLTNFYALFENVGIAVPAVEGTGNNLTWYYVSDASLITAGLPPGVHSGVFLQGNYNSPNILTDDDTNGGVFSNFNWNGTSEVESSSNTKNITVSLQ